MTNTSDAQRLDLRFYEGLDVDWIPSRAYILYSIVEHFDEARRFFSSYDLTLDEGDSARFSAEVYFTQFMQFETVFALLLAPFQNMAHWVFLTEYETRWLKNKAQQFLDNDFASLTDGICTGANEFFAHALYGNLIDADETNGWAHSILGIQQLLETSARRYLNGQEYNAYKHGTRLVLSKAGFTIAAGSEAEVSRYANNAFHYLQVGDGRKRSSELKWIIKSFEPEEAMNQIYFLHKMLETIRNVRLGKLRGDTEIDVMTLPTVDKKRFDRFRASEFIVSFNIKRPDTNSS